MQPDNQTNNQNNLLIINRYTNPNTDVSYIMAHVLDLNTLDVVKSYPKADGEFITFFDSYDTQMVIDVAKSKSLAEVNIIRK